MNQYIRIELDKIHSCTRDPEPDGWDAGDWHVQLNEVRTSLVASAGTYAEKNLPNVGDTIYVLVERLTTGSTFGQTTGDAQERGWYKTEAEAVAAQDATAETDGYFDHHEGWEIHATKVFRLGNGDSYGDGDGHGY